MATRVEELVLTASTNAKRLFEIRPHETLPGVFAYAVYDIYPSCFEGQPLRTLLAGGNSELSVIQGAIRDYIKQNYIVLVGMDGRYGDWYLHFPNLFT